MIDVVVARYNENIDWILPHMKKANFFIYNKGEELFIPTIKRKNINRESETYLYHIINNYENLSDYILFIQGNPFDHYINFNINYFFDYNEVFNEYLGLRLHCDHYGFPQHPGLTDINNFIKDIKLFNVSSKIEFYAGAQFIINKDDILKYPKEWWENLYNYSNKYIDSPWMLERLWLYIFGH